MKTLFVVLLFIFTSVQAFSGRQQVLSEIYQMSLLAVEIGNEARSKILDPRLREFNQRLISDHQVSMETIEDTVRQIDIELDTHNISTDSEIRDLKGRAYEKEYLKDQIEVNSKLLNFLKDQAIPTTDSSVLKTIYSNYLVRVSKIVSNARYLQKTMPR